MPLNVGGLSHLDVVSFIVSGQKVARAVIALTTIVSVVELAKACLVDCLSTCCAVFVSHDFNLLHPGVPATSITDIFVGETSVYLGAGRVCDYHGRGRPQRGQSDNDFEHLKHAAELG